MPMEAHQLQLVLACIARSPDLLHAELYAARITRIFSIPGSHASGKAHNLRGIDAVRCQFGHLVIELVAKPVPSHRHDGPIFILAAKTVSRIDSAAVAGAGRRRFVDQQFVERVRFLVFVNWQKRN